MGHKRPKFKKETGHFALTKNTYHERIDLVLKTDDNKPKALCLSEFGRNWSSSFLSSAAYK